MTDYSWTPLEATTEEEIAAYRALHEGVTDWMKTAYWEWITAAFTERRRFSDGSGAFPGVRVDLAEHAAQALSVQMGSVRQQPSRDPRGYSDDRTRLFSAMRQVQNPLNVADFILAHHPQPDSDALEKLLHRSRSVWTVGERNGRPGLVRRLAEGVQEHVGHVVRGSAAAGTKLGQAWEAVYGLNPDPTKAYVLAVRAVEDAAIPEVVSKQDGATLGHVIGQLRADGDWRLPLSREDPQSPTQRIVLDMCAALWKGHHDRHGGVPGAPETVSQEEAEIGVSLAVSLVHWFTSGLVARRP